ncbi:hypothetical protein GGI26_002391 [Coemansia sp. RSA 1358]|uniref:F-box domain-containing protein n=1 Tax=Coemansia umbellata TaxID=1424467 RepID=A0ABQ8PPQ4_9FUNG|nr:hypothetical protein BX070DRAFT_235241 [Coemansia spiralis]KAJ1992239.1 hypothetical protein EDC05_002907 [Coemansia umbellata]KAJ2623353.1 hypothetical protein GGI26_002391 [Coemansia sp. RSA 1358]
MHDLTKQFSLLGLNQRITVLKEVLALLSPHEQAIARQQLLISSSGAKRFDIISCLPTDIVYKIINLIPPSALRRWWQVNKRWRQYAQLENVVNGLVKKIQLTGCIPSTATTPFLKLRWIEDRELRWEKAQPAISKAIYTRGNISTLAVGGGWMVASCNLYLKAWKIDGAQFRLGFQCRTNSANCISVCPSGKVFMASSFLRETRIYSLVGTGTSAALSSQQQPIHSLEPLFEVRSAVVSIDRVHLFRDYAAVKKRNNTIDVYRWKERALANHFSFSDMEVCDMKICKGDYLVISSNSWEVAVFDINTSSELYRLDAKSEIKGRFPTTNTKPTLKATCNTQSRICVSIFCEQGWLAFVVQLNKRCSVPYILSAAAPSTPFICAHMLYALTCTDTTHRPDVKAVVQCNIGHSNKVKNIVIPKSEIYSPIGRTRLDRAPDVAAMTDDVVALGYGSTIALMKFIR